jgi:hypothetical protein
VHDVGAVEPLALHDERLLPDQLLAGNDLHRHAEHLRLHRVVEPAVVDLAHAVAGVEHQVDEVIVLPCLAEPVGEGELGAVARVPQRAHRAIHVRATEEEVEVLRVADDSRVLEEGVRAADEKWHRGVAEHVERATVEGVRVLRGGVEGGLTGHGGESFASPGLLEPLARILQ